MVYFKESYNFPRVAGSTDFSEGVQLLISLETDRTCDYPRGFGP